MNMPYAYTRWAAVRTLPNNRPAKQRAPSSSRGARVRRVIEGAVGSLGTLRPSQERRQYLYMLGLDVQGFGKRDEQVQLHVRSHMYEILIQAFADARLRWPSSRNREDRGDGLLILLSPDRVHKVLEPLVQQILAGLRRYNVLYSEEAQISLRLAVHAGHVYRDEYGLGGDAVNKLFRLLNAAAFKEALDLGGRPLGLLVSGKVYEDLICPGPRLIDPDSYMKLAIVNKETNVDTWLYLPARAEVIG